MERRPHGVPAPPNEVQVVAEVLSARPDPAAPQRWQLEIRIRSSERIAGPNFAHPGETYRANFNQPLPDHLSPAIGASIEAGDAPEGESEPPGTDVEPGSDAESADVGGPPPPPPPDLEQPRAEPDGNDASDPNDGGSDETAEAAETSAPDAVIMRARCEFMGDERGGAFHIMSIDDPTSDDLGGPDPV